MQDSERIIEFEFVRATENAALNAMHWIGRGDKEAADEAACDAIYGVFDQVDMCGEVVIGEGIKDNAPGIFLGDKLGTWREGSPRFDIALDPVDGTTNISKGMANSISVMSATLRDQGSQMKNIPSFYTLKLAFGPTVAKAVRDQKLGNKLMDWPVHQVLMFVAMALGKRMGELVVLVLDRPRNQRYIDEIRAAGASLRMVSDGDITAAVAPSLPDSGVDLYLGSGGTPEGILTACAVKALNGEILQRMYFRDESEKNELAHGFSEAEIKRVWGAEEVVPGHSAIFCATGISDSFLLPGVKFLGKKAITHSILMRAKTRTVRYIRAVHDLETKTIKLRSESEEHAI